MLAEGELRSNLDESDKVRDLQDRIADLKAEVCPKFTFSFELLTVIKAFTCLYSKAIFFGFVFFFVIKSFYFNHHIIVLV